MEIFQYAMYPYSQIQTTSTKNTVNVGAEEDGVYSIELESCLWAFSCLLSLSRPLDKLIKTGKGPVHAPTWRKFVVVFNFNLHLFLVRFSNHNAFRCLYIIFWSLEILLKRLDSLAICQFNFLKDRNFDFGSMLHVFSV